MDQNYNMRREIKNKVRFTKQMFGNCEGMWWNKSRQWGIEIETIDCYHSCSAKYPRFLMKFVFFYDLDEATALKQKFFRHACLTLKHFALSPRLFFQRMVEFDLKKVNKLSTLNEYPITLNLACNFLALAFRLFTHYFPY